MRFEHWGCKSFFSGLLTPWAFCSNEGEGLGFLVGALRGTVSGSLFRFVAGVFCCFWLFFTFFDWFVFVLSAPRFRFEVGIFTIFFFFSLLPRGSIGQGSVGGFKTGGERERFVPAAFSHFGDDLGVSIAAEFSFLLDNMHWVSSRSGSSSIHFPQKLEFRLFF